MPGMFREQKAVPEVLAVVVMWEGEGLSTLLSPVFQEKPEIWVLTGDLRKM